MLAKKQPSFLAVEARVYFDDTVSLEEREVLRDAVIEALSDENTVATAELRDTAQYSQGLNTMILSSELTARFTKDELRLGLLFKQSVMNICENIGASGKTELMFYSDGYGSFLFSNSLDVR